MAEKEKKKTKTKAKRKNTKAKLPDGVNHSKNPYIDLKDSGGGRPIKIISDLGKDYITKLSHLMCPDEEIAAMMSDEHERISVDTLTNENNKETFAECKAKGQAMGKVSLRRNQFALSKKNANMAIFLGKNYLGQSDKVDDGTEKAALDKLDAILEGITDAVK